MANTIIIGGDILPTKSNSEQLSKGKIDEIVSLELLKLIDEADYRIFNLETPICDVESPIEKEGPCFRASCATLNGIKKLNPDLFTLANNHILDQGEKGLKSTLTELQKYKIKYVGVGNNLNDASQTFIFSINCKKIGVYACAEHEYSLATSNKMGANPFDPLESLEHIRKLSTQCDFIIVLYHGGKEYYEFPSPMLQKRCRKMIECGANIIVCQHSHCIGTIEHYHDGIAIYGQGNFLLDRYVKAYEKYFQTGFLVSISIDNTITYEVIPIVKNGNGVRMADKNEKAFIMDQIKKNSEKLNISGFVEQNYQKYIKIIASRYIVRMSRLGYILSSVDNRFFKGRLFDRDLKKFLGKHQRLAIQNCLQCEVHNEVLQEYLKMPDDN